MCANLSLTDDYSSRCDWTIPDYANGHIYEAIRYYDWSAENIPKKMCQALVIMQLDTL